MPNSIIKFDNFSKMLVANTIRFQQPKNTLPRINNLLGTVRGGLVTCDGTRVISSPNGNATPVPGYGKSLVAVSQAFSVTGSTTNVGLFYGGGVFTVADMTTDPWTVIGTFLGAMGAIPPQIVQTMSGVIFLTGYGNTVYQWSGIAGAGLEAVINVFNATNVAGTWTASATYAAGFLIVPTSGNGYHYMASPGGIASGTEPSFNTTVGSATPDGSTGLSWVNMGPTLAPDPPGSMHGAYHMGSVWLWGAGNDPPNYQAQTGPSAYWVSDLQDLMSYNPLNQGFVGLSDGQQAMGTSGMSISEFGIAPQSALVFFKEYSTYQLANTPGASNFSIATAQTNMGCVAPRTIAFMSGVGLIRMAHLGVAVFDGMRDKIISEEIRPYLLQEWSEPDITLVDWNFITSGIASFSVNPPMYIMGLPTVGNNGGINRFFVYDFILQSWTVITFPFFITSIAQFITENSQPMTVLGSANDGTLRRWQYGDAGWDVPSTPVDWSFRTPEVFTDQSSLTYYKWMQLRYKLLSGGIFSPSGISINDGLAQVNQTLAYEFTGAQQDGYYGVSSYGDCVYRASTSMGMATMGIQRMAYSGYVDVFGSGQVEIQSIHFDVQGMPPGTIGRPM